MFDWLLGKPKNPNRKLLDGLVWATGQGKFEGIKEAISEPLEPMLPETPVSAILLIAHFKDTWNRLNEIAESSKSLIPVEVLYATDVCEMAQPSEAMDVSRSAEIIVAERHPRLDRDRQLIEATADLPFPTRMRVHISLDDALMRIFAGGFVKKILAMGGFDDETPIESRMVDRRITECQRQIMQAVTSDLNADSAEEWMQKNGAEEFLKPRS